MRNKKRDPATSKRKAISRKDRFAIFGRDGFTCQYCGQSAPDVVLHVDHVRPVSKGGSNEFTNLTTACSSCNSGKSDTELGELKQPVKPVHPPEVQSMINNNDMLLAHLITQPDLFEYAHKILTLLYVSDTEDPLLKAMCNIIDALDRHDQDLIDTREEYE